MKIAVLLAITALTASTAGEYVVGFGDTLWELSLHFYGTPLRWEEILAANPQVSSPQSLVPGMVLTIPGVTQAGASYSPGNYTVNVPTSAIVNRSSEPILSRLQREGAGMVSFDGFAPLGRIIQVNTEEEAENRFSMGLPGDLLEIDFGSDRGVEAGQVFHIMREGETVNDPFTGDRGRVYRVAGVCSVLETTPSTSIVKLEHGYLAVRDGDLVTPYRAAGEVYINNLPVVGNTAVYVLALKNPDNRNAYAFDVIYINAGTEAGFSPGDVFSAYSYGEQYELMSGTEILTADIPIADVVILTTERRSAAAMVVSNRSATLVAPGDRLYLVRSQTAPAR